MMKKESKCPRGVYKVKTYGTLHFQIYREKLMWYMARTHLFYVRVSGISEIFGPSMRNWFGSKHKCTSGIILPSAMLFSILFRI